MIKRDKQVRTLVIPGYVDPPVDAVHALCRYNLADSLHSSKLGGGVFTVSHSKKNAFYCDLIDLIMPDAEITGLRGTEVGNTAGKAIRKHIEVLQPARVPLLFHKINQTKPPKRPKCRITCEHIDWSPYPLQAVLQITCRRKQFKCLQHFVDCLCQFDVLTSDVFNGVKEQIIAEFKWCNLLPPKSALFSLRFPYSWSIDLLLGIIAYAGEWFELIHEPVDSIHLFASIEGQPRYREFWSEQHRQQSQVL